MTPTDPLLTIAIPTYNRCDLLKAQLTRLAPQLSSDVVCCVYDNASSDSTAEVASSFHHHGVRYACNPVNYGAMRNLTRCFEECRTEWLWVLSDDDLIHPEAVKRVFQAIRASQAGFILTAPVNNAFKHIGEIPSVEKLLGSAHLGPLFFISIMLFNAQKLRPFFSVLTDFGYTRASQLALVLAWMEKTGGVSEVSPIQLLDKSRSRQEWPALKVILGLCHLPECLRSATLQRHLALKVFSDSFSWTFVLGLRETQDADAIRRWKRVWRQTRTHLACYGVPSPLQFVARNFHRHGFKRVCLDFVLISLLAASPLPIFRWIRGRLHSRFAENAKYQET